MKKRKMKVWVKILIVGMILCVIACIPGYIFIAKPILAEYNRTGFIPDQEDPTKIMYKNENREYVYGAQIIEGKHYYFDPTSGYMQTGFVKEEQDTYYYDTEGVMVTGMHDIEGNTYLFGDDGIMKTNMYQKIDKDGQSQISYFDQDGKMLKGKQVIDGQEKLFDDSGKLIPDMAYIQNGIQEILNHYRGDISIYFKDLNTGNSFTINDHTFYPCCMIKVPSLITVYNCIRDGKIQKTDQVARWIDLMIRISDNTSFNSLMQLIGGGDGVKGVQLVTQTAKEMGLENTEVHHGLKPGENYFTEGGSNKSCPKDIALAFEKIYNHEVATPELCDEMIEILKTCDDYEELQAGLPEGLPFAHKTGCAYELYHDGGIVYLDGNPYIIVCFSDKAWYTKMMSDVSKFVYEYQSTLYPQI